MKRKKISKREKKLRKKKNDHKYYLKVKNKRWYKEMKRQITRRFYKRHKDKILRKKRRDDKQNRAKITVYMRPYLKKYRITHKRKIKKMQAAHYQRNKKSVNKKYLKYITERLKKDLQFKLSRTLRSRLSKAVKGKTKAGSALKDLGCTLEFFKKYIEKKFYGKMTWNNWGKVWHLDHIIPLWKFDLTDPEHFKQAVNFKNIQPLTVTDHRKKTAKEIKELRALKGTKNGRS